MTSFIECVSLLLYLHIYTTLSLCLIQLLLSSDAPDVVLYLCEKEHVEGGMIFQLLEDLTEMSTMRNCKDVFGYIESKQDILGKVCAFYMSMDYFSVFCFFILSFPFSFSFTSCYTLYGSPHAAWAFCSRKTCDVENMQSTSSSSVKGGVTNHSSHLCFYSQLSFLKLSPILWYLFVFQKPKIGMPFRSHI